MTAVLYSIIGFLVVENLVELWLTLRQLKVYETSKKVPKELTDVLKPDVFEKARLYGIDKAHYEIFKTVLCDIFIISFELYCGFIALFWNQALVYTEQIGFLNSKNEIHVSVVFLIMVNIIGIFKELPFSIYSTFVLEEKHGFNKQTPLFFAKDQVKAFFVGQALTLPLVAGIIYIVQIGGEYFFVWLWVFVGVVSLLLITFYPVYIAPLFDKFRPLDQGDLRSSIEELAASLKFPVGQLMVVEGSKRSHHSNAYFTGLWGVRRIVLFDTLLLNKGMEDDSTLADDEKGKGCTNEEVLAVLAHELGHWKLGHMTRNIFIMQIQLLLVFVMFSYLFKFPAMYEAVGFVDNKEPIIIVGFLVILTYILAPFNTVVSFLMTLLSRKYEYQADAFAKQLGFSKDLCKALIKLHVDNLGFPIYDPLYSSWNHSHPTLLQRMARLKDDSEDSYVKEKLTKKMN
ncbi:unnamed protein product [Diamesa serratosioi]